MELFCLICNSNVDAASCTNIFYTSLSHSDKSLANLITGVIQVDSANLHSSYVCTKCYDLLQLLEQAQKTAAHIENEIFKSYNASVKKQSKDISNDNTENIFDINDVNFVGNLKDVYSSELPTNEPLQCNLPGQGLNSMSMIMPDAKPDTRKSEQEVPNNLRHDLTNTITHYLKNTNMESNGKNLECNDFNECITRNDVSNVSRIEKHVSIVGEIITEKDKSFSVVQRSETDVNTLKGEETLQSQEYKRLLSGLTEVNNHVPKSFSKDEHIYTIESCRSENTILQEVPVKVSSKITAYETVKNIGNLVGTEQKDSTFDEEKQDSLVTEKRSWKSGRISKYSQKPLKYSCPTCGKKWRTTAELKTHMKSHSNLRPFMCEKCGQVYKHKYALEIHIGMHNGVSPFQCSFCKKCFTQKGTLMRHLPIHTGETPYQCELCGKRFVHHTSYNMHALSHTGKKSYHCHICDLSLLSTSHLKRHMRVHTGEKPYSCSLCGKQFAQRYNLFAHQKIHNPVDVTTKITKKVQYKCDHCDSIFYKKQNLNDHVKQNHIYTDVQKRDNVIESHQTVKTQSFYASQKQDQVYAKPNDCSNYLTGEAWKNLNYSKLSSIDH